MSARRVGLATLLALTTASATAAQQGPPEPLPPRVFSEPGMVIGGLENGAGAVFVENHEVPLVTVDLLIPGGQASDPAGLEGLTLLTASLLESGTATRDFRTIVSELDQLGASLNVTADADFTRISLAALANVLEPALEIMAEVVISPTFPEDRVEAVRGQAMGALAAQRGQAGALARRVMLREVFRDHPYGGQTTEATVAAIDRQALLAHHDRWYRPESAFFAVAGAIDFRQATLLLNRTFGSWRGGASPAGPASDLSDAGRASRVTAHDGGIVLVHRPGSVQAEVRIGHALPGVGQVDWTALEVAVHHLGANPTGLLMTELRERLGYTYVASANAERRVEGGLLEIAFATRTEVAADALGEALRLVDEVARRPMSEEDLDRAVSFLAGVFPLRYETAQQVAAWVTEGVFTGFDQQGFGPTIEALHALVPGEVRRAFATAVDPARTEIVVVGDATILQPLLAIYGEVRVERPDGTPLSMADLTASGRSAPLSAMGLPGDSYRYEVTLQGQPVGSLLREFSTDGELRSATSRLVLGPTTTTQSVSFTERDFRFVDSAIEIVQGAAGLEGEVRLEGGRLRGYLDAGQGRQDVDLAVPADVLVSDMLELAVWIADLEVGLELRLPVASVSGGTVSNALVRVEERTEVTVPAGTFEVFRVEIEGAERQTIWARVEAPHVVVRVAPGDQPILVELAAVEPPSPPGG